MKEVCYTVDTGQETVLQALGGLGALVVSSPTRERLTYRDTFDWRLHRAGYSLSTSGSGKRTRGRIQGSDGLRIEAPFSGTPHFSAGLAEGPVRALLLPLAGPRRLLPMGKAEWTETVVSVLNDDQKTVVRLALRAGEAFRSGTATGAPGLPLPIRVLVRGLKGYRKEAKAVRKRLVRGCGAHRYHRSEAEDALTAIGNPPGAYSPSLRVPLDDEMEAGESFTRIHRALLEAMSANREGVIRDWDPEFLHDFRVACRRARTGLTQVRGVFPDPVVHRASKNFKWLGGLTGPKRDLDVYLQRIPVFRASLSQTADDDLEPLVRHLEAKQEAAQRQLVRGLKSHRFSEFIEEWSDFLQGPSAARTYGPDARAPVAVVVTEAIRRALARVLEEGSGIEPDTEADALHRLRISCKKLRYLITMFRSLFPPSALAPVVREMKLLQDHLGAFNDLHVQQVSLRTSAAELMDTGTGPPSTLLAMGQLLGRLEGDQAREREAFESRFSQFARRKNLKRFEALFGTWEASP